MKENVSQSLSAMLDNESESFEVRRTLDQLDHQNRATWSRYQSVSALLKGDRIVDCDISARVMTALEAEPVLSVKTERSGFLSKPVASVAIAASVTALVIFGVQNFQANQGLQPQLTGTDNAIVLPGPQPANPALMPAQYGALPSNGSSLAADADVIRLSSGVSPYIKQHQSMMTDQDKRWAASWLPKGYQSLSHDVRQDTEVLRYTDGRSVITVFVEPDHGNKASGEIVQSGETVALGKQVGQQYVTVVGDVPLMIADRIASAIQPLN